MPPCFLPILKLGQSAAVIAMTTQYIEEYQKQFIELQQKFFDTWLKSVPNGKDTLKFPFPFPIPDAVDKSLEVQEELVKNYLAAQETAMNLALETQKKFWDNYFELMKKATSAKVEATPY